MATNNFKQTTGGDVALWQHQGHDLAERQWEELVPRHDLFLSVRGSVRCLAQWHFVGSQRPRGPLECCLRGQGVDHRSHAEALQGEVFGPSREFVHCHTML